MDSSTASNRQIFLLRERLVDRGTGPWEISPLLQVDGYGTMNAEGEGQRKGQRAWLGIGCFRGSSLVSVQSGEIRPWIRTAVHLSLVRTSPCSVTPKSWPSSAFYQPTLWLPSLSLSPFLCRFNLTRIGLPCTHPRNHSYGFTSVVDNRTRLPRNFCTARTCFSCRQTCPSISRKSSPWKLGATLWKLGSRGRLGKSTLLATIVRAKNLNGSRFSIGL